MSVRRIHRRLLIEELEPRIAPVTYIYNVYDLQNMRNNLAEDYILANDIDASETSTWNGGLGFDPVGDDYYNPFRGTFDGQGHIITGLYINRPSEDYVGLFGYTTTGVIISNVGLKDVAITSGTGSGGLAGFMLYSTVTNSYVTGSVNGGDYYVGGLVGYLGFSTVSNAYAATTVYATERNIGGLVGGMWRSTVINSFATGAVNGGNYVGGLVGVMWDSTVTNSFATGAVSGVYNVGGLVGSMSTPFSTSTVSNSYAIGAVRGGGAVGGLVGDTQGSVQVSSSYWDIQTSGQTASAGGIGKTTAEMKQQATFVDWDFVNIWKMTENVTYPRLRWAKYRITDVYSLQAMQNDLAGDYILVRDIDASATSSWNGGLGFDPVGDDSNPFCGSFDGQGYTITGLYINRPPENYVGLFGYATTGVVISNVGLEGVAVTGKAYLGGLVGFMSGSTLSDSYATGEVNGSTFSGGLVGLMSGSTLSDSYATGAVNSKTYSGGLVGYMSGGTVFNSYATGAVNGNNIVGGLVGYIKGGTASNSYATGAVSGGANVGGLMGAMDSASTLTNSYATGAVSGSDWYVGGLVGYLMSGSTVSNSYATGTVKGTNFVGGLVGRMTDNSKVYNSYATGAVTGGSSVGGLAGFLWECMVFNSYATGTVKASGSSVGGLVGYMYSTSMVSNSYATGVVTGGSTVGGLVGLIAGVSYGGTMSNCYAAGAVSGGSYIGGLVGHTSGSVQLSSSYWDIETSGQTASAGGIGKTTAEMKQQATFVDWDFLNTWGIVENETYPYLLGSPSQAVTSIQLLPQSDTGINNSDRLTNKDNSSGETTLIFRAFGTVPGATVTLYYDGQSIGSAVADTTSTDIETNGAVDLADGARTIIAKQKEPYKSESLVNPTLSITIDTVAPATPNAPDLQPGSDTGMFNWDNITTQGTPTLDLAGYTGNYYRLYRDGVCISGLYDTAAPFTDTTVTNGAHTYVLYSVDAAGNVSDPSLPLYMILGEGRELTLGTAVGFTDDDGTVVTVKLTGAGRGVLALTNGAATGAPIGILALDDTTAKSNLTITFKDKTGAIAPGSTLFKLLVGNPTGSTAGLGTLSAKGLDLLTDAELRSGAAVKSITLGQIGDEATIIIGGSLDKFTCTTVGDAVYMSVAGSIGTFTSNCIGAGAQVLAEGSIKTVNVKTGDMLGAIIAEGEAGIDTINVPKGLLNGTIRAGQGGIKTLTFGGSSGNVVGLIQASGTAGIGAINIPKGGFDGAIEATKGGIKSITIGGSAGIAAGSTISAGGIAGIGMITVKGNVPNLILNSAGPVNALNVTGSSKNILTLGGVFNVVLLKSLNAADANVNGLTLGTVQGIGKLNALSMTSSIIAGTTIGDVKISNNLTDSLILGAYYLGANGQYEYGAGDDIFGYCLGTSIKSVTVGGTMSGTSIAANVLCGPDHYFGTPDDDKSLPGSIVPAIKAVTLKARADTPLLIDNFAIIGKGTGGTLKIGGVKTPMGQDGDTLFQF